MFVERSEFGSVSQTARCFSAVMLLLFVPVVTLQAQPRDPGIRPGGAGAGKAFATGLTAGEAAFFDNPGKKQFIQEEQVSDGLGPRFNLDSCGGCHIFPDVGGSSPPPSIGNPQVLRANLMAPGNTVPSFLRRDGPVREVRFVKHADGTVDGSVHAIFTISGRADKPPGCNTSQPNFSNTANMVFRIPTPTFGAGLIEAINDRTIKANLASDPTGAKAFFGIKGHVNTNGNDNTVTRFGWKAQNKSLLIFSGEAYNVEMGVTNENFPTERSENHACANNRLPENQTDFNTSGAPDIVAFMGFMKFLDQPKPACGGATQLDCASVQRGRTLFDQVGCGLCHTPTLMTGLSKTNALNQKPAHLFSDLAVHHMGSRLADGVTQGSAGPDEFRTAPLWGVGQRAFFLHDGRTSDLLEAILAHDSTGSEADRVTDNFQFNLNASQKQDILNFLRSL